MSLKNIGTMAAVAWAFLTQGGMTIWYARIWRLRSLREALVRNAIFSVVVAGISGITNGSWFIFVVMTLVPLVGTSLTMMLSWADNAQKLALR